MTATNKPMLDAMPSMVHVAEMITKDAVENLGGVEAISIGPIFAQHIQGAACYTSWTILTSNTSENSSSLTVNVRPTAEILDASERWTKCGIAIMEHRPPQ